MAEKRPKRPKGALPKRRPGLAANRVLPKGESETATSVKRPKGALPKGKGKAAAGSKLVNPPKTPRTPLRRIERKPNPKPKPKPQLVPETEIINPINSGDPGEDARERRESSSFDSADSSSVYPTTKDTLSMDQLKQKFGIAAAVLANNPSLVEALDTILGKDGQPMITDPALQKAIIQGTSWYRDQTDTQRTYDYYKATNPGQFAAALQLNASKIVKQFASLGLSITAQDAIDYANNTMKQVIIKDGKVVRFNQDYLNKLMSDSIKFTKTGDIDGRVTYTGLAGKLETMATELYGRAWEYGFPATMSNEGFSNWFESSMRGLVAGTLNPEDVDNLLQQRAKSFAPGLARFIDQGQTLRQAADPHINVFATTWEVDPDSLDLNNDYLQRAINHQDEKGNFTTMNLYDTKKLARRSDNFDLTQQAKEEKTGMAQAMLRDFQFLA